MGEEQIDKELDNILTVQYNLVTTNDLKATLKRFFLAELEKHEAVAEDRAKVHLASLILSEPTEGLFDNGDLFIKRARLESVLINELGYERVKAMKEAATAADKAIRDLDARLEGK